MARRLKLTDGEERHLELFKSSIRRIITSVKADERVKKLNENIKSKKLGKNDNQSNQSNQLNQTYIITSKTLSDISYILPEYPSGTSKRRKSTLKELKLNIIYEILGIVEEDKKKLFEKYFDINPILKSEIFKKKICSTALSCMNENLPRNYTPSRELIPSIKPITDFENIDEISLGNLNRFKKNSDDKYHAIYSEYITLGKIENYYKNLTNRKIFNGNSPSLFFNTNKTYKKAEKYELQIDNLETILKNLSTDRSPKDMDKYNNYFILFLNLDVIYNKLISYINYILYIIFYYFLEVDEILENGDNDRIIKENIRNFGVYINALSDTHLTDNKAINNRYEYVYKEFKSTNLFRTKWTSYLNNKYIIDTIKNNIKYIIENFNKILYGVGKSAGLAKLGTPPKNNKKLNLDGTNFNLKIIEYNKSIKLLKQIIEPIEKKRTIVRRKILEEKLEINKDALQQLFNKHVNINFQNRLSFVRQEIIKHKIDKIIKSWDYIRYIIDRYIPNVQNKENIEEKQKLIIKYLNSLKDLKEFYNNSLKKPEIKRMINIYYTYIEHINTIATTLCDLSKVNIDYFRCLNNLDKIIDLKEHIEQCIEILTKLEPLYRFYEYDISNINIADEILMLHYILKKYIESDNYIDLNDIFEKQDISFFSSLTEQNDNKILSNTIPSNEFFTNLNNTLKENNLYSDFDRIFKDTQLFRDNKIYLLHKAGKSDSESNNESKSTNETDIDYSNLKKMELMLSTKGINIEQKKRIIINKIKGETDAPPEILLVTPGIPGTVLGNIGNRGRGRGLGRGSLWSS